MRFSMDPSALWGDFKLDGKSWLVFALPWHANNVGIDEYSGASSSQVSSYLFSHHYCCSLPGQELFLKSSKRQI